MLWIVKEVNFRTITLFVLKVDDKRLSRRLKFFAVFFRKTFNSQGICVTPQVYNWEGRSTYQSTVKLK